MTNLSIEEQKKRSNLIIQARQMINKEHLARCTLQHQQWVTSGELAWRTNGTLLPYPSPAVYPSEDDIVAKALELYNASMPQSKANLPPLPEVPPLSTEILNPEITTTVTAQLQAVVPPPLSDPVKDYFPETVEPEIVEPEIVEPEIVEPEIVEPEIVEPEIVPTETTLALAKEVESSANKHSLLRNVLSGWLQKNKNKES